METEEKIVNKMVDLMWEIAYITQNPQLNSRVDLYKENLKTILKEFKQEILKNTAQQINHLGF
jgi:hypothetical protein